MVLKDFKVKAVECLINNFNAECENEPNGCNLVVNDVTFFDAKSVEKSNDYILIRSAFRGEAPITGCIAIDEINTMYYMDDYYNIVSLTNIEF